jgi:hypothetical protein
VQAGVESLETRARLTGGPSSDAIYRMVAEAVRSRGIHSARLVDVGCGSGALWPFLQHQFSSYCGIDALRYDGFPSSGESRQADFDRSDWSVDANVADLVVSLETIEHVENPWAFMRGWRARQTRRVVGRHDSLSTELVESRDTHRQTSIFGVPGCLLSDPSNRAPGV